MCVNLCRLQLLPTFRLLFIVLLPSSLQLTASLKQPLQSLNYGLAPSSSYNSKQPPPSSQLNCDFDLGFCGWKHDNHADFSWTRGQGETPSGQTGPPWDHTTRDKSLGHYIYIETSSPRHSGDKARLVSPVVPHPGTYCLSFWHYMHGVGIEDLNIYKRTNTSYVKLVQLRGPWSVETTSQSNPFSNGEDWWNEENIEFISHQPYQLIIEGVRGGNFRGDIALDDLQLLHAPCQRRAVDCDFEADMCGWRQMNDDDYNWMPNKGPTQTRLTGPDRDHTFGSQNFDGGRYLYTEVSWPRTIGEKAKLLSPVIYCTEDKVPLFQFWYHMHGQSVGSLRVYLRHYNGGRSDQEVWGKKGDQLNKWNLAQILIPDNFRANLTFQIIIEAERSTLHQGDIAIDDILLTGCYPTHLKKFNVSHWRPVIRTDGASQPSQLYYLNCNFDKQTLCMWTSQGSERYTWQTNHGNTTSELTGPRYDHSTGDGWYIYTEASSARRGDKAVLKSQPIAAQTRICFQFYYHMYGKSMGRLELFTTPLGTNRLFDKWSVDGEKSINDTDWRKLEIEITEPFDFHIVIRATRGSDFYSDIAIDDLQVINKCTSSYKQISTSRLSDLHTNSQTSISVKDLACTFDDFTLCNWTQSYVDNFDWTVSNGGRTLSFGTGPDQDHTSGNGQFAYIESSNPRKVGDRAILESPIINITDPICLTIWWHMYGKESGSIELHHHLLSNDSKQIMESWVLWSDHGDRGNKWHKIETSIVKAGNSRIEIHGVRGSGWMSDIAIDDITIETGECEILNCSFDVGLCGWKQHNGGGDVFDWKRRNGRTETARTGPKHDHTTRLGLKNGYYLFIESSNPRGKGDKARIISPIVEVGRNAKKCLTFWYHMYGNSVGEINVYKNSSNNLAAESIWKRNRNSGDRWMMASIDLEDVNSYKIIIEGIRGWGSKGDVAIDDVTIRPGMCVRCCNSASSKYFQCANFECIPKSKQCDGKFDCEDASDEEFCQGCGVNPIEPLTSNKYGHVIDFTLQKEPKQPNIEHRTSHMRTVFSKEIPYVEVLRRFSKKTPQALRGNVAGEMFRDVEIIEGWNNDVETPIFSASFSSKLDLKRVNKFHFTMKKFIEWFWNVIRRQTSSSRPTALLERLRRNAILKISGGNNVKLNSWPWQAAYFVIDLSSTTPVSYICGATLIDRYWVLTAAHCPGLGHQHSVVLGAHDILHYTGTEQKIEVEAVYVNENYTLSNDLQGDIALVKLRTPAKSSPSVQTACLLRKDDLPFSAGHVCMTTGWGRSSRKQDIERVLRQGEVPLVNNGDCQNIFYPAYTIHDRLVCAGGTGANSCLGDSGGPLVCKRNDRHYLVGITSWGDADCKLNIPGAYTRVQSYMEWIEAIISHHRCPS